METIVLKEQGNRRAKGWTNEEMMSMKEQKTKKS